MTGDRFIYLAAPYSHPDPAVIAQRMETFCRIDAKLIVDGKFTVSPLSKHFILSYEKLSGSWEYWQDYCRAMLRMCGKMIVICMPGWKESIGLQEEIKLAEQLHIPISYVDELGLLITE